LYGLSLAVECATTTAEYIHTGLINSTSLNSYTGLGVKLCQVN